MKQNKTTIIPNKRCGTSACLECTYCHTLNYEERRVVKPEANREPVELYGAEALSYYFYLPTLKLVSQ